MSSTGSVVPRRAEATVPAVLADRVVDRVAPGHDLEHRIPNRWCRRSRATTLPGLALLTSRRELIGRHQRHRRIGETMRSLPSTPPRSTSSAPNASKSSTVDANPPRTGRKRGLRAPLAADRFVVHTERAGLEVGHVSGHEPVDLVRRHAERGVAHPERFEDALAEERRRTAVRTRARRARRARPRWCCTSTARRAGARAATCRTGASTRPGRAASAAAAVRRRVAARAALGWTGYVPGAAMIMPTPMRNVSTSRTVMGASRARCRRRGLSSDRSTSPVRELGQPASRPARRVGGLHSSTRIIVATAVTGFVIDATRGRSMSRRTAPPSPPTAIVPCASTCTSPRRDVTSVDDARGRRPCSTCPASHFASSVRPRRVRASDSRADRELTVTSAG